MPGRKITEETLMAKVLRGTNLGRRVSHTISDKREGWVFTLNYMHL